MFAVKSNRGRAHPKVVQTALVALYIISLVLHASSVYGQLGIQGAMTTSYPTDNRSFLLLGMSLGMSNAGGIGMDISAWVPVSQTSGRTKLILTPFLNLAVRTCDLPILRTFCSGGPFLSSIGVGVAAALVDSGSARWTTNLVVKHRESLTIGDNLYVFTDTIYFVREGEMQLSSLLVTGLSIVF